MTFEVHHQKNGGLNDLRLVVGIIIKQHTP